MGALVGAGNHPGPPSSPRSPLGSGLWVPGGARAVPRGWPGCSEAPGLPSSCSKVPPRVPPVPSGARGAQVLGSSWLLLAPLPAALLHFWSTKGASFLVPARSCATRPWSDDEEQTRRRSPLFPKGPDSLLPSPGRQEEAVGKQPPQGLSSHHSLTPCRARARRAHQGELKLARRRAGEQPHQNRGSPALMNPCSVLSTGNQGGLPAWGLTCFGVQAMLSASLRARSRPGGAVPGGGALCIG